MFVHLSEYRLHFSTPYSIDFSTELLMPNDSRIFEIFNSVLSHLNKSDFSFASLFELAKACLAVC